MAAALYVAASSVFALSARADDNVVADDDNLFTRLNPELEEAPVKNNTATASQYPYIRTDLNTIIMNGDNWEALANLLEQSRSTANFTVVHIGDSHIQADGNTGTTRKLMQQKYGDAGRGLVIPFKLAGTNEPRDYRITSSAPFVKATLMRRPYATRMGFTGVSLHPETHEYSFTVSSGSPCGFFTVMSDGNLNVDEVLCDNHPVGFEAEAVPGGIEVSLDADCKEFTVSLSGDDVNIYGFDLRNDSHGVLYHAIGNNGASYYSYNGLADFGNGLASLDPDLVVVSLGTNEAFGNLNDESFTSQLNAMIRDIRRNMPDAKILLTTPSECQRSVTTYVKGGKKRKGRKVTSYQVNGNVARVRRLILDFGERNNIPVYDFYAVAGGEGASDHWVEDGLLSRDRIHRTWDGYRLDGQLFYDALVKSLTLKKN